MHLLLTLTSNLSLLERDDRSLHVFHSLTFLCNHDYGGFAVFSKIPLAYHSRNEHILKQNQGHGVAKPPGEWAGRIQQGEDVESLSYSLIRKPLMRNQGVST